MEPLCSIELVLVRHGDGWVRRGPVKISTVKKQICNSSLVLTFRPATVADLKEEFELKFSIPTCVQELSVDGCVLNDTTMLKEALRDGDAIKLCYKWEGNCTSILKSYRWFQDFERSLQYIPPINFQWHESIKGIIMRDQSQYILKSLSQHCSPWFSTRAQVNKMHFFALGGVDTVLRVLNKICYFREDNMMLYTIADFFLCLYCMSEAGEVKEYLLFNTNCLTLCLSCISRTRDVIVSSFSQNSVTVLKFLFIRNILALLYRYDCLKKL